MLRLVISYYVCTWNGFQIELHADIIIYATHIQYSVSFLLRDLICTTHLSQQE